MAISDEWEVEVRVRRKGRLVKRDQALGDSAESALYAATNDLTRWAQDLTAMARDR